MPRHSPAPQRPPLQAARQSRIAQRGRLGKWLAIIGAIAALASPFTFAPATAQSTAPATLAPLIGANLPAISDYSPTPVYVDLVRQARRFGTAQTPWDEKAILAPDGWPMGDFGCYARACVCVTVRKHARGAGRKYVRKRSPGDGSHDPYCL